MLDVYELCTSELQEKMLTIRSKFKEVEDKKLEKQQQKVRLESPLFTRRKVHFIETQPPSVLQVTTRPDGAKEVKYEPFSFPDGTLGPFHSTFLPV